MEKTHAPKHEPKHEKGKEHAHKGKEAAKHPSHKEHSHTQEHAHAQKHETHAKHDASGHAAKLVAVIRIRGIRNMKPEIKHTFKLLRLFRPNHCILVNLSPQMKGMLNMVKDYVTYGGISEETLYKVLYNRGEMGSKGVSEVKKEDEIKKIAKEILAGKKVKEFIDPIFRLRPPRRGYGDIKMAWPMGELGKRDEIDTLIRRMI